MVSYQASPVDLFFTARRFGKKDILDAIETRAGLVQQQREYWQKEECEML